MFWIYDFFFGFTRFPGKVYNAIENTGFSNVPGIGVGGQAEFQTHQPAHNYL
jgi:hypothetical protein